MNQTETSEILKQFSIYYEIRHVNVEKKSVILTGNPRFNIPSKELKKNFPRYRIKTNDMGNEFQEISVSLKSKEFKLNILLLLLTILTTLLAGALMEGAEPWKNLSSIWQGIPFSLTLMLILGAHELGHFLVAKKHGVDASFPYFIPAPTPIGTFGAFIKMRSRVSSRKALIQIGAAGPIAGFCVALPAFIIGIKTSTISVIPPEGAISFGDSILTWLTAKLFFPNLPDGADIMISSVGFAAWIGFLVTMLNLLPIGQLDGGHIAYGILGKRHNLIAKIMLAVIVLLGTIPYLFGYNTLNWLIWAALVFFIVKTKHPPIMNHSEPLTTSDIALGIIALIIFILTFIPVPVQV